MPNDAQLMTGLLCQILILHLYHRKNLTVWLKRYIPKEIIMETQLIINPEYFAVDTVVIVFKGVVKKILLLNADIH